MKILKIHFIRNKNKIAYMSGLKQNRELKKYRYLYTDFPINEFNIVSKYRIGYKIEHIEIKSKI